MERWAGKIAVVTGASAGIGEAIAKALVRYGMVVVGLARRVDRVQEIAKQLTKEKGKLYALKADVSNEGEIKAAFKWVRENLKTIHVLVNNAGILIDQYVSEPIDAKALRKLYDVNVIGLSICTSEALQLMRDTGVDDGHIIHINRVINLLGSALKLTTQTITKKIISLTAVAEQQEFRSGRSCTDAVFVLKHVIEKSIEFNAPAYVCFIDLQEAFDRIRFEDVIHLLHRGLPGHSIHPTPGAGNIPYISSKHAVTVLTEGLRRELVAKNSKIRVSSVSPGLVRTDIFEAAHDGRASTVFQENPYLNQEDIADAIIYVLGAPPHVQVHEITIKPVGEKM